MQTISEIMLIVDRKRRGIKLCDIRYVEACNKQIIIYTQDEKVSSYTTIEKLEKLLNLPSFLRCHRSYIVNMDYIEKAKRDFVMRGGGTAYISHTNQWKVRNAYHNYVTNLTRDESLR